VGLLATNSLRQGKNREVLERILRDTTVFFAESDRAWTLEGAAVRVSMVGFGAMESGELRMLDGREVLAISSELASTIPLDSAQQLPENRGISFMGNIKAGPFDIPGQLAAEWLALPANPNGRPNSDVLKPWRNGEDITGRPAGKWIIDFGLPLGPKASPVPGMLHLTEAEASFYEAPFRYAEATVKPMRAVTRTGTRRPWFVHREPGSGFRRALFGLQRFLATVIHAKHRLFVWMPGNVTASHSFIVFATDEDAMFGLLHSRIHEVWALAMGSFIGVGNDARYTPNTTFETFPFPAGWRVSGKDQANTDKANEPLAPKEKLATKNTKDTKKTFSVPFVANPFLPSVAEAAQLLHEARERWLNPEGASEAELKKRTLTALYNDREAGRASWLNHLHRELDRAVLAAYGWSDLAEPLFAAEDALRAANPKGDALGLALGRTEPGQALLGRLLALNLERAKKNNPPS
jgi:hypothetical protein